MNIILVSESPRRKELLSRMGLSGFKTISPDIDENLGGGLSPSELVSRLSALKAQAVAERARDTLIIAADTVVAVDGAVLGKPSDALEAF